MALGCWLTIFRMDDLSLLEFVPRESGEGFSLPVIMTHFNPQVSCRRNAGGSEAHVHSLHHLSPALVYKVPTQAACCSGPSWKGSFIWEESRGPWEWWRAMEGGHQGLLPLCFPEEGHKMAGTSLGPGSTSSGRSWWNLGFWLPSSMAPATCSSNLWLLLPLSVCAHGGGLRKCHCFLAVLRAALCLHGWI